jgi:hypothetical protein
VGRGAILLQAAPLYNYGSSVMKIIAFSYAPIIFRYVGHKKNDATAHGYSAAGGGDGRRAPA